MKHIKSTLVLLTAVLAITFSSCTAQIKNTKTRTLKVYGNCDMCKKNIETATYKKGISKAVWDKETKMAILNYDSTKTNQDEILKRIALAGYDSDNFLAPDDAYNKLDECCQYERIAKHKEVTASQPIITKDTTTVSTSLSAEVVFPLAAVYTAYFELKDALTKDDGTKAAAKAKELFKAVDAVPMEKLKSSEHTIWMKYEKLISYDAEHIKGVTETEHQREHFASLSKNMIELMKTIKPNFTIYIDHCPMYNDNKGADWISKESGIKNPYYGAMMLTCGKTTETIK
jgi:copper chaperone CopZ